MTSKNIDIFLDVELNSPFDEDEEPLVAFYVPKDSTQTLVLRLTRIEKLQWALEFATSQNDDDELEV